MINLTGIARPFFRGPVLSAARSADPAGVERVQRAVLARLLSRGRRCEYGVRHGFGSIAGYEDFAARVPLVEYEELRSDVMRMVRGGRNVLWPGVCRNFAQSSGTSGGKSKYIPVTADSLRENHYAGGSAAVAFYLNLYPDSRLFGGRSFILGGSFSNELDGLPRGVRVGDLSASLIANINPLVNLFRVPSRRVALMADWRQKLPALVGNLRTRALTHPCESSLCNTVLLASKQGLS